MQLDHIRTPHGLVAAKVATTYHMNWMGYRNDSKINMEKLFEAAYGKPMEMLESPNDTSYSHEVKKETLDEYDTKDVENGVKHGYFECWRLGLFLTDLCNKDIIPPGHYLVRVSW